MTRNVLDVKKPRDVEFTGFFELFRNTLEVLMVPEAGIEPARRERRGILNPDLFSFKSYSYDSFREYARSVTI